MRDGFSKRTIDQLAKRVAFTCSFPGCRIITVGPGSKNNEAVVNLGEAAHITAASVNGPRYDEKLMPEQRKNIENAIWMCRHHARMIDSDHINYSADTLLQWKKIAEEEAYRRLAEPEREEKALPTTLIAIGQKIVFEGMWKSIKNKTWTFEVGNFLVGQKSDLMLFNTGDRPYENYIVVESQGDGRVFKNFVWQINGGTEEISVEVEDKVARTTPYHLGDLSLGADMDLEVEDGDIKLVKGEDCAKQDIMLTLSTDFGDLMYAPTFGSLFSAYYWAFKDNPGILVRLIKIEITRLLSIPHWTPNDSQGSPTLNFMDDDGRPAFDYINRVINVELHTTTIQNNRIFIHLRLEWGDGKHWEDDIPVIIRPEHKVKTKLRVKN